MSVNAVSFAHGRAKPSGIILAGAQQDDEPFVMLRLPLFTALSDELGGYDKAVAFLKEITEQMDRPMAYQRDVPDGKVVVTFLAPRSWSLDRLMGWVGGRHEQVSDEYGPLLMSEPPEAG